MVGPRQLHWVGLAPSSCVMIIETGCAETFRCGILSQRIEVYLVMKIVTLRLSKLGMGGILMAGGVGNF